MNSSTQPTAQPNTQHGLFAAAQFLQRVTLRFMADDCLLHASALGYATLLAIVPLVVLGFSMFAAFDVFAPAQQQMQAYLLKYMLPTGQEAIEGYFSTLSSKAGALSVFGIAGLLVTATLLIGSMEQAFNHIWRVKVARSFFAKFSAFWFLLTLTPLLLALSLSVTTWLATLPLLSDVTNQASSLIGMSLLFSWAISSIVLMLLYKVLPNTPVPLRAALFGGLAAGAMLEITKYGFAFYVTHLANYEALYGALGVLPLFLVWLYLIWLVVLIGAEIVWCLQHPVDESSGPTIEQQQRFALFCLTTLLAEKVFGAGQMLTLPHLSSASGMDETRLTQALHTLSEANLLRRVAGEERGWLPAAPASAISLWQLHQLAQGGCQSLPASVVVSPESAAIGQLLASLNENLEEQLRPLTLTDLLAAEP